MLDGSFIRSMGNSYIQGSQNYSPDLNGSLRSHVDYPALYNFGRQWWKGLYLTLQKI